MRGKEAEEKAAQHLAALGRDILHRNYRLRGGEIDIVSRDGDAIVFSEVRHRSGASHGSAAESVTPRKLALLRRAAEAYLLRECGGSEVFCRFEIVALDGPLFGAEPQILPIEFF